MKNAAYLKYFAALLLFGTNGRVASHIALASCGIVLLRTLIGSAFLAAVFALTRQKITFTRSMPDIFFLIISGAAMGASWMFLYEAYRRTGVGASSLAYYCGPVIVMALSPLIFGEKLTLNKVCGAIAVLCGVFLVDANAAAHSVNFFGLFCGAMSAVMYAAMVIFNKKAERITGLENAALQLFVSFITVAVFTGLTMGFSFHIDSSDWLPILILGFLNTGVGCYFYFSSIGSLPVQAVAVCGCIEPLSAVVFSAIFLKETMSSVQMLGAVLIITGAVFAELKKQK